MILYYNSGTYIHISYYKIIYDDNIMHALHKIIIILN